MAKSSARSRKPAPKPRKPLRPLLLAGGLGLIWFIEFQQPGLTPNGPGWSYALVLGVRLVADTVCARLLIAIVQLLFATGRLGLARLRVQPDRDAP